MVIKLKFILLYYSNMQNCIQDTLREATNIGDFYPGMKDEPPLICNINNVERVNKRLLETSVLLKGENIELPDINSNYNNRIYSRNVPSGDFKVNVESRPVPSSPCANVRFQKERNSLDKYNSYKAPNSIDELQKVFLPGKGTIKGYFDNIDMESEFKNINKIDTKCSLQLFKIHPLDSQSSLYENKDYLIKNYKELEKNNGYTWNNFNQFSKLGDFAPCETIMKPCPITEKEPKRHLITDPNIKHPGHIVTHPSITSQQRIRELEKQKRDAELIINMNSNPNIKRTTPNIISYKSSGVQNIYAPIIKSRGINEARAEARGMRDAAEVALKNPGILKQPNCFNPVEIYNIEENVNLSKYNCIKEHQELYTFNKPGLVNKDCLYCEKLFNNFTKRKYIIPSK